MRTTSAYKALLDEEKNFLRRIAEEVAMLVATPKKMNYFQKQLTEFAEKWENFRDAYKAHCKGKWQPSMGQPSNPLGTIWPYIYGLGRGKDFLERHELSGHEIPICGRDVRWILGDYALLAVIHDNVLPRCPSITTEILPKDLAKTIWRNLITGVDVEGTIGAVIQRKDKIESFLNSVKSDVREHFTRKQNLPQLASSDKAGDIKNQKPAETGQKDEGSKIMVTARTSKENWEAIRGEYDISKKDFGKKINFVSDSFKRSVIFRDVEHAFVLASAGFPKPALILSGGVIEELLRLYLKHKRIPLPSNNFVDYIKVCEQKRLLKSGISKLSDSVREFRNLVHISEEKTKRHTISKATAKGAVSSIFTIANDFQ
jgi:hypothetical protein